MKFSKTTIFLFILTLISAFFHFYNLNWGAPFYFHPDERNIASAITQLSFPFQMNPHFFAYGSFPLYSAYFLGEIISGFHAKQIQFDQAIIASRIISATLATCIIPLLFLLGKKIKNTSVGIIAAVLAVCSTGFIQFAHFGTVEIWQTFLSLIFFNACLDLQKTISTKNITIAGILFGLLVGTKVSSLPFGLLFLFLVIFIFFHTKNILIKRFLNIFFYTLLFCGISFCVYVITNPFVFIDTASFLNSMQYESSVALGSLPVFYTGEFFHTIPILFQFLFIYPFLVNPLITIIFIPSFLFVLLKGFQSKNFSYILLSISYLLLFLPPAFLFTKWTRYILPTLPCMYLIISIVISNSINNSKQVFSSKYLVVSMIIGISIIFSFSYFKTVLMNEDTRVAAAMWAKDTIAENSSLVSEVYDLGIIPFNQYFSSIKLFDFYAIDTDPNASDAKQFIQHNTEYIILPSQRLIKTRLLNSNNFPKGNQFYQSLENGSLGFEKVYQTPCDIFCHIIYMDNPIFSFEETASVFDRPVVMIYKKK